MHANRLKNILSCWFYCYL